jgi:hypothetical protein
VDHLPAFDRCLPALHLAEVKQVGAVSARVWSAAAQVQAQVEAKVAAVQGFAAAVSAPLLGAA